MPGSYVVVIHYPGRPPEAREFSQARAVIGREAGDILLPDAACSSTHAELSFDGHTVRVRDLGSTNGTWMNGQRVSEIVWPQGTVLHIGAHQLTLQELRTAGPVRGRTVAVSAVPGGVPPTVPGAPVFGQVPHYGPAPGAAGHAAPPGFGAGGASAYGQHPRPHAAARGGKDAKKGSSSALWVILGLLVAGTLGVTLVFAIAIAGKKDRTTSTRGSSLPMKEAREATVKFVWFTGKEGSTARGGASPERIRVGPNSSRVVSVGISEEFAGGSGDQWRTATWLAAFNASRALGGSLVDYDFNVHVGGLTDGPSAGMLTTASMIALMRGVTPRIDTTMTGTINPDGTAGPVSGIVQKMEGAREAGLKRFGFPLGTRNHKDLKTGQIVDLLSVAQSLGLEARELNDLYDAYAFMTTDKLPRVAPIAESELEPGNQTQALLRSKLAIWKTRVDSELAALKTETARAGGSIKATKSILDDGQIAYDSAQRHEQRSFLAAALDNYALAVLHISVARRLTKAGSLVRSSNLGGLVKALGDASSVNGDIKTFSDELAAKEQHRTRGGQVAATLAFTAAVQANGAAKAADRFATQAQDMLKAVQDGKLRLTNEKREELLTNLLTPLLYYDIARTALDYAKDVQVLSVEEGTSPAMDGATLERTVAGYASASAAVFAYLDALVADQFAHEAGVSAEQSRALFAQFETEYQLGREMNAISEGSSSRGASIGAKLMRLAAASGAFLTGAKLVNKYYSLGARPNKEGKFELENRRALAVQLDLARQSAREAAARAKDRIGFVPAPARIAFQSANAQRDGTDDEKLKALAEYWRSAFFSELAGG